MAFGIDDALSSIAAGLSLAETLKTVIGKYRFRDDDIDIETLIEQVRVEVLRRINVAHKALADFENLLDQKGVDVNVSVIESIKKTSMWKWSQRRILSGIVEDFSDFHKKIYSAIDDVAALVQCKGRTEDFGLAVVESSLRKGKFHRDFLDARSIKEKIAILRSELDGLKNDLK